MDRRNTFPASASNGNAGAAPSLCRARGISANTDYRFPTQIPYINMTSIRDLHPCSANTRQPAPKSALPRTLVKEVVDLARGLRADPRHFGEIGRRGALDRLQRPEMMEQGTLASRTDSGDFL